ncbi:MAG TPA: hypothetical protein VG797_11255 [Phycisphaerales bacterium]|nr:hypothetical protein [Phycisphaerales bacterium]
MPAKTMRIPILLMMLIAAGTAAGQASTTTQRGGQVEPPVAPSSSRADSRAVTLTKLQRRITVEIIDQKLVDVVQFLRDFAGADIDPLWTDDRHADGLEKDRRITMTARDETTLNFIERLLDKAGDDFSSCTWQMSESGAIEIGPRSRLNREATLKVYDVHDLLFEAPNFTNVPQLSLEQVLNQSTGKGGGGGGGGGVIQNYEAEPVGPTEQEMTDKIIRIITNNIEFEQWRQNGGDGATIDAHNGTLLVRAPDYIHRQIAGYSYWRADRASRSADAAEYRARVDERATIKREALAKHAEEQVTEEQKKHAP